MEEMLKAKRDEGLSQRYLQDLDSRIGRFAKDFQCSLTSVSMDKIKDWLQAMPVGNRTRNNFRMACRVVFKSGKECASKSGKD
jgi:hypothetical protein